MMSKHLRHGRLPVFSRLSLAWAGLAATGVALASGTVVVASLRGDPAAVSLKVDADVQRMVSATAADEPRRIAVAAPQTDVFADIPTRLAADAPDAIGVLGVAADGSVTIRRPGQDAETVDTTARGVAREPAPVEAGQEPREGAGGGLARVARTETGGGVVITIDGRPVAPIASLTDLSRAATTGARANPGAPIAEPVASLLRQTPYGAVPQRGADGARAARRYAKPFAPAAGRKPVALIVGGLGLNDALTRRAIDELPAAVTLAFAPYGKRVAYWAGQARQAGHEVLIELPMEARRGDPAALGPAALLADADPEQLTARLDWLLSRFSGYVGVTNYLGGRFSRDRGAMGALLSAVDRAGLAYFDDTGALGRADAPDDDRRRVDKLIAAGPDADEDAIAREFKALERAARRSGAAVGKAYAYDAVIDAAAAWTRTLEADGLQLAPASAVLRAPAATG